MKSKIVVGIFVCLMLISLVSSFDWIPPGDIEMGDFYSIKNGVNATFQWFNGAFNWTISTLDKYIISNFDGSNIDISLNETELNNTIILIDTATNDSMKSYVDAQDIIFNNSAGNYSDAQDVIFNDSMKAYSDTTKVNITGDTMTGNLNMSGNNITNVNYGFFTYLGSLLNRITSIFVGSINATGNIATTGNMTASNFFGNLNASYIQNNPWIEDSQESSLNVNSSNYWDGLNTPNDFTTITASGLITANEFSGALNWTFLQNYPSTCTAGQYISAFGDTLSCAAISITESQISDLQSYILTANEGNLNVNSSDWWRTNEGHLKNVADISGSWINNDLNWINSTHGNTSIWSRAGTFIFPTNIGDYVGIGTSSPQSLLHVDGSGATVWINGTGTGASSRSSLILGGASGHFWGITQQDDGSPRRLSFAYDTTSATATDFVLTYDGKVGIGTYNPISNLHIHEPSVGTSVIQLTNTDTGATVGDGFFIQLDSSEGTGLWNKESTEMYFATANIRRMTIDNAGLVGIGIAAPTEKLQVSGNIFMTTDNNKMLFGTAKDASIYYDGVDLYIDTQEVGAGDLIIPNGQVGIGTNSPNDALEVYGDLRINTAAGDDDEIFFTDNGQIRSFDNNHRIIFNRTSNIFEIREFGDIIFSAGSTTGIRTSTMYLDNSGNVGIGTSSPGHTLTVKSGATGGADVNLSNALFVNGSNVGIGTVTPNNLMHIWAGVNGEGLTIQRASVASGHYADLSFLMDPDDSRTPTTYIRTYRRTGLTDNDMLFHVGGTDIMFLDDNGNVGIGTVSPEVPLHIVDTNLPQFRINYSATESFEISKEPTGVEFKINNNPNILFMLDNGFIGIDEFNPDSKLEVKGEVHITDVNTGGNAGTDLCIDANGRICACGSCA